MCLEASNSTRLHQSYIAVFRVPVFLGMRFCRGVVLWLHENYIGFFPSYIRDGSLETGRHGGGPCPYTPRGPTTFDSGSLEKFFLAIERVASKLLPPSTHLEAKNLAKRNSRVVTER